MTTTLAVLSLYRIPQEAHPLLMNEANVERLAATLCRLRCSRTAPPPSRRSGAPPLASRSTIATSLAPPSGNFILYLCGGEPHAGDFPAAMHDVSGGKVDCAPCPQAPFTPSHEE